MVNTSSRLVLAVLPRQVNLSDHAQTLASKHGSLRAAARVLQIDVGYLSRIISGEKENPSAAILRRMGVTKTTIYEVYK